MAGRVVFFQRMVGLDWIQLASGKTPNETWKKALETITKGMS
jgi:hypothetical protein